MKFLFALILFFKINILFTNEHFNNEYCSGYLGEVYFSLDAIEDDHIRHNVEIFFNDNFRDSEDLNYDLYYNQKIGQFLKNINDINVKDYKIINYPNFEIIILNAYIKSIYLNGDNKSNCPSFGYNCSDKSLSNYFDAAEDFSWRGEANVINFLKKDFIKNKCFILLSEDIKKNKFVSDLNFLIKLLLKNN